MKITLNNRDENFDANELSINDVLKLKNFSFKLLVVKLNGKLVRRHEYDATPVKEGDSLTVLHLISGG